MYWRTRSAMIIVGLDVCARHASHVDHFALIADRRTDCGERPTRPAKASISEINCSMHRNMGKLSQIGKGNNPMAKICMAGQNPHMQKENLNAFVRGLKLIMETEGLKMKPTSEAAGMGESGIRDLIRHNSAPKVSNAYSIASTINRTVDEIIHIGISGDYSANANGPVKIAVAGRVGGGAEVQLSDPYSKGDGLYRIACPPQIGPHGIVAVEVEGPSMEPAYEHGDILFYSRDVIGVPTEAIGKRCIVEDADGMVWIKLLRRRDGQPEGLFDLISFHADSAPMYDVAVKWAAPVKMHLGKDLIKQMD